MSRHSTPAPRGAGLFPKIMFIAVAGMLIPPTLLVYGILAVASTA